MERLNYFKQFHNISDIDYHSLIECLKTRSFKKGSFIIARGEIQRELYFVKSGVQMSYFDSGDKVFTLNFTHYPHLCAIAESFSFQVASKYHIVCLTDSELEYISYEKFAKFN